MASRFSYQSALPGDSVTLSEDHWSLESSITAEWRPCEADVVLLYIELFTETPMVVWLTRQTPVITGIPLAMPNTEFRAYGLNVWRDQSNFTVQSSFKYIWVSPGDEAVTLDLDPHQEERSVLDCFDPVIPITCTVDKSGSFVEGLPTLGMSPSTQTLLLCQESSPFQEWVLLRGQPLLSLPYRNLEAVLPSRRQLSLRVLALEPQQPPDPFLLPSSASAVIPVRAYLSKKDLEELMRKALDHRNGHKKVHLPHFFRDKPGHYFYDILVNRGGLMETRRKDAGGDQDSAINNGNLFGLFFSAALYFFTEKPPTHSPFGDRRLLVAAPILFCDQSHLYFADFYCMYDDKPHYVTLVLTKQGSEADQFCQKRLLKLYPDNNPFLTREPDLDEQDLDLNQASQGHQAASNQPSSQAPHSSVHPPAAPPVKVYTTLSPKVLIEVLYTEDINITELQEYVSWGSCDILGRGSSSPDGIPKNPRCRRWCNLPRVD